MTMGSNNLHHMKNCEDIADFIEQQDDIVHLLKAVDAISLPDCWIGAGLIRNAVWDHLHGRVPKLIPGSDVDVVYFDPRHATLERDETIEDRLTNEIRDVPWSVSNQARMHVRNGDMPYSDVEDALRHWPETATAIGARIGHYGIELVAPYGVEDLIKLIVRPTPAFANKMDLCRKRISAKSWTERWPKLSLLDT
ncbi:MAG: nucleotidyltransferase family protein [Methyloligellaceae bacterium]